MTSRCIVNVATGDYVPLQKRLVESLRGWPGALRLWEGSLPEGSPSHEEDPYAFKLYALAEAGASHRYLLWLDSPVVAAGDTGPLWKRIERDGHLFVASKDRLGNWASDECLAAFGLTREAALGLPLMNGSCMGLDLGNARARRWFEELWGACRRGLFRGPYLSDQAPPDVRARKPGKPAGFVSRDPRCWGHRHDEAVGSCLAHLHGLSIEPPAPPFPLLLP
jgi:hypothetical protein